jgi:DNA-binding PadR family transcriptional regulator
MHHGHPDHACGWRHACGPSRDGERGRGRRHDLDRDQHPHDRAHGPEGTHGPEIGGDRHRHGRRGQRLFDHGELRLVVLALIAERPRHGYEIIKEIEDRTAGTYSPSPGVIYPTLTLLEEIGHASVAESAGKKLYAVTGDGGAYLAASKVALDAALGRMRQVSAAHGGGPAPEIVRATENLRMALRLRQGRGPLTAEQVRAIAAALDAAAVAIERA